MMGDRTIGLAILGVGRWGRHLVRNFATLSTCRIVAIADPNPACLYDVARQYKLPLDVMLTEDWQQALAAKGVEAVAIATPASTHTPLIRTALSCGLHVLVEKPITLEVREAQELCALAEDQNLFLLVDHTYLFHPAIAAGKMVLQSSDIGHPRYGYAARTHLGPIRSDVDVLWDLAIHDIAIFNHWLGDRPSHAQATETTWLQPKTPHPVFPSMGLPDVVWATLIYPSGFRATLHLSWLNPDKQRRLCIVGNRGTLIFDEMQTHCLTLQRGQLDQNKGGFHPDIREPVVISTKPREPLREVCIHFLSHIHSSTRPSRSTGRIGLELVQILTALTQSLKQGNEIMPVCYSRM